MTNRDFLIRLLEDSMVAPYTRGLSYSNESNLTTAIQILESGINLDLERQHVNPKNNSVDEANESAIESIVRAYGRVNDVEPPSPYTPTPIGIIPDSSQKLAPLVVEKIDEELEIIPPTKVRKTRQSKSAPAEHKDSPDELNPQQDN